MEKIKLKFLLFLKKNRLEVALVTLIVFVALVLRLYKIDQFMTFLGDEGRDVRVLRDLLRGNLVFIGPQTSIGNMYLGPLYYYLVAPTFLIANYNPVGPAIQIAFIGTFTVFLTWAFGRKWFGKPAGLIAALLFALSPVAIVYSRSSWNPNPMPLFTLISVWGIWQVWAKKKFLYLSLVGVSMAFALQMHYLGLLLLPVLGIFWLLTLKNTWSKSKIKLSLIKHTLLSIFCFLVLMSPLALFDLKHDFMNFNAFKTFFSDRQTTINLNPARSDRFSLILSQLSTDFILSNTKQFAVPAGLLTLAGAVWLLLKNKKNSGYLVLITWLFFGLLGLVVYKQHVYDHYYGFLFPAIYLLLGFGLASLATASQKAFKLLGVIALIILIGLSLSHSPVRQTPNNQLARTRQIIQLIIKESGDQPFNFGLIAKQNYDESYRYFLEYFHAPAFRGEDKITEQLFVACEDGDKCQPEGNPAYQVAIFGPSHIVSEWNVGGIKVYRLFHTR